MLLSDIFQHISTMLFVCTFASSNTMSIPGSLIPLPLTLSLSLPLVHPPPLPWHQQSCHPPADLPRTLVTLRSRSWQEQYQPNSLLSAQIAQLDWSSPMVLILKNKVLWHGSDHFLHTWFNILKKKVEIQSVLGSTNMEELETDSSPKHYFAEDGRQKEWEGSETWDESYSYIQHSSQNGCTVILCPMGFQSPPRPSFGSKLLSINGNGLLIMWDDMLNLLFKVYNKDYTTTAWCVHYFPLPKLYHLQKWSGNSITLPLGYVFTTLAFEDTVLTLSPDETSDGELGQKVLQQCQKFLTQWPKWFNYYQGYKQFHNQVKKECARRKIPTDPALNTQDWNVYIQLSSKTLFSSSF